MALAQNPIRSQNFMKQLLTTTQPRSFEEEQKRLSQMQKVSTVSNALKLMGDMAGLGIGADVTPMNDQVLPYTMNRMQEIQNMQLQDEAFQRNAMIQNMYKAMDYDITERRRADDRDYRSKEKAKDREYTWDMYDQRRDDRLSDEQRRRNEDLEDYKKKQEISLQNRAKATEAVEKIKSKYDKQYDSKDIYMEVPMQDGSSIPLTELQAQTYLSYLDQYHPDRIKAVLPMIGIDKWDPKANISDYQVKRIITTNWDALGQIHSDTGNDLNPRSEQPTEQPASYLKGVSEEALNKGFDAIINSTEPVNKKKESARTLLKKFTTLSDEQIDAMINNYIQ